MSVNRGNTQIAKAFIGSTEIDKIYRGSTLLFQKVSEVVVPPPGVVVSTVTITSGIVFLSGEYGWSVAAGTSEFYFRGGSLDIDPIPDQFIAIFSSDSDDTRILIKTGTTAPATIEVDGVSYPLTGSFTNVNGSETWGGFNYDVYGTGLNVDPLAFTGSGQTREIRIFDADGNVLLGTGAPLEPAEAGLQNIILDVTIQPNSVISDTLFRSGSSPQGTITSGDALITGQSRTINRVRWFQSLRRLTLNKSGGLSFSEFRAEAENLNRSFYIEIGDLRYEFPVNTSTGSGGSFIHFVINQSNSELISAMNSLRTNRSEFKLLLADSTE